MNLLDKLRHFTKSGLAILLVPFFFACDDPTELGLELELDESEVTTQKIEFTLPASNIVIDSLRTDHFTNNVFGQYKDSIIGGVTAIAYNTYGVAGGMLPDGDTLSYVSTEIILKVRNVRAKGILPEERISIHEIGDTLYSQPVYLADRELTYDQNPIADYSFEFNPNSDSIITIPMNDGFGRDMYNRLLRIKLDDGAQDSLVNGLFHYPPLAFVPGENNEGLFSIDLNADTTRLVVNLISDGGRSYTFNYDFKDAHFTHIKRDRTNGKLSGISSEYTPGNVSSSRSYLDMISGVYPKLDLQPFQDFISTEENFIINKATLSLEYIPQSSFGFLENASSVSSFFIKDNGKINGAGVVLGDGLNNVILQESGYLSSNSGSSILRMSANSDNSTYSADVTLFSQILADNYRNSNEPLTEQIVLYNIQTLDLGFTSFKNSELKLTVYYTTKNE